MKDDTKNAPKKNYKFYFIITCIIIIFFSLVYPGIIGIFIHTPLDRGLAGDMYGILNAIFSGLAFAGVIITILMQMQELELTRDELSKSALAQQGSHKALQQQLQSMNLSNKISGVAQYIESHNGSNDEDKRVIAKLVLQDLVENIFYEDKYREFVIPNLKITRYEFNSIPTQSKMDKEFRIYLKNISASAYFYITSNKEDLIVRINRKIRMPDNNFKNEILKDGDVLNRGNEYFISVDKINPHQNIEINVEMTGEVVKVKWSQKIYIIADNKLNKVDAFISEVNLFYILKI